MEVLPGKPVLRVGDVDWLDAGKDLVWCSCNSPDAIGLLLLDEWILRDMPEGVERICHCRLTGWWP